jgi:hypothetical protein
MPEFTTVSVQEAQIRTIPGRQGTFMNQYIAYIQQLPAGQAGRLRIGESEKHPTIRRRLISAANALHIPLPSSGQGMTSISGGKTAEKNNREGSNAIPDERWRERKQQHWISHSPT